MMAETGQIAAGSGEAEALRRRMVPPMPGSALLGWLGPLVVTAFGAFLRFYRLSVPRTVVFDETYYVGDAWGILRHGVEINHVKNGPYTYQLTHGGTHILASGGEFVVHPPLGKILIAVGEWLFGLTPFGWRFSAALVGSLSILMVARIARRMTRSTLLGCVAGLLMAIDGLELVMSRTALLDIFVMFWTLAAFGCLLIDRDRARARVAEAAAARRAGGAGPPGDDAGPHLGIRWWRVAAGICLGCATASKWNGACFIIGFGCLAIAWDIGARRAAGFRDYVRGALLRDGSWLPLTFGLIPLATYVASYAGWFASPYGWDRDWAAQHGNHVPVWSALDSLLQYTLQMWHFSITLAEHHPYAAKPWTWLWLGRPTSFFYATPKGCGAANCSQEVLAIGTPLIWWASIPALVVCLAWWMRRRDWRAGAVLVGVAAAWLPWFWFQLHDNRTEFYFYAIALEPFLVLAITLVIGLVIGPETARPARRATCAVLAGAFLVAALGDFAYIYPVLAAKVIPYSSWYARMWYHGWI
jgi:dolichyl-phosphate-mannose-protein mannosyltransferase